MNRRQFLKLGAIAGIGLALPLAASSQVQAEGPELPPPPMRKMVTDADRRAAAARAAAMRAALGAQAMPATMPMPGGTPDYFGLYPNYANSQLPELDASGRVIPGTGIRKFVDSLPGLGAANANNLGQYIPVAIPDQTTYPGSDYYEIELRQYTEQMHSDLPPTTLRGYVQVNTSDPTVSKPHYMGPMIIAQKDRPVRVKFTNKLPTGAGGDLFIPVDTTAMGAGMGPQNTVTSVTLDSPGSGYATAPAVSFSGGGSPTTPATAVATMAVSSLSIISPGTGFTSEPTVVFTGGNSPATNASATAVLTGDVVTAVNVTNPGSGYTSSPVVSFTPGTTTATATATLKLGSVTLVSGGSGYTSVPTVTLSGGGFTTPASVTAVVNVNGTITGFTVTNEGAGYTAAPTIVVSGGGGAGAIALPNMVVDTITLTSGGSGYVTAPTVFITGGAEPAVSASATATVSGGVLSSVTLTNKGNGYTSAPVITLAGGGGSGAAIEATMILDAVTLTNGGAGYSSAPSVAFTGGGPLGAAPATTATATAVVTLAGTMDQYTQNRASVHLHGGVTPWISDGTPHQWITPADEMTPYPKGVSARNVPDMPDPGPGSMTFYYTNQQSARLMFYHDHAYGITRLTVYSGQAAGYLIEDPIEKNLVAAGIIPSDQIPLIIQDKTFVPKPEQLAAQDPTWDSAKYGGQGSLWFPHVYMPNQNPFDPMGMNAMGRWDYGPWFWPPFNPANGPVPNPYYTPGGMEPPEIPGTPNPSLVPEAFMDTPVVNGTAYPYLEVQPKPYRFRILNACNDRSLNLQLYLAKSGGRMWDQVTGALLDPDAGEVPMVPAVPTPTFPPTWPTDGRAGGVPDPNYAGPSLIQIGTEGGFLPAPAVLPNQPVNYNYNRRDIVVLNVQEKTLFLGPAERADVIVDFTGYEGQTLILYNDAPAPVPAFDPRYDYYTGDPDQTATGGAPTTLPGYGPNTRTIMQIRVTGSRVILPLIRRKYVSAAASLPAAGVESSSRLRTASTLGALLTPPFDLAALQAAFASTASGQGAFAAGLDPIIVPQAAYDSAYNGSFSDNAFVRIQDTSITFTPLGASVPLTLALQPKAIQELFELQYGRMNATLGVELPNTNGIRQTTIPYGYIDPITETIWDSVTVAPPHLGDGTQIWKITHNGVDTHAIHFHLFNVQLINRVGWDGAIRPPDPNELGWKETVRMNPLEDAIVALRPVAPKVPFGLPESVRTLDVTAAVGSTQGFYPMNPYGYPVTTVNLPTNFGAEYVWHCHLLGHEENDMMRPMVFRITSVIPPAPTDVTASASGGKIRLTWSDPTPAAPTNLGNPANEIGFSIEREDIATPGFAVIGNALANATSYVDASVSAGHTYRYRVTAYNAAGGATSSPSAAVSV